MASKDKWVRRFSVDETAKHKNGFTIYKITSVLFPISSPEAVTTVSVWKRYSDVQRLHKSMRALHAGLHLRGAFPPLPKYSYFKRFQREVIEERSRTIKTLLEFVAEHRLLFTSTDFVNFLQTGYPAPEPEAGGVINAIRSALQLPLEDSPPLEYQTDDEDRSPAHVPTDQRQPIDRDETDYISQIPIYEAAGVEIRASPDKPKIYDSFESLNSLESIDSDLYEELSKVSVSKPQKVLPDLISFDAPSTSRLQHHAARPEPDAEDISAQSQAAAASAAECSRLGSHRRAFQHYKTVIELMLRAVQAEQDPQRRALMKEKTNKYLSQAEEIYKNHLCEEDQEQSLTSCLGSVRPRGSVPAHLLRRQYEDLSQYRVLGVLGASVMLVLHREHNQCYAMKVVRKIPNNLTEFDEYFLQRTNETHEPILPTDIPYMVTLHSYIETNNLLFLILSYAPGEKLFDYIKRYIRSTPHTPLKYIDDPTSPLRHVDISKDMSASTLKFADVNTNTEKQYGDATVRHTKRNLEVNNIGTESTNSDVRNENEGRASDSEVVNNNSEVSEVDEVSAMVLNSQKLLKNVDKALSGPCEPEDCGDQNENAACNQVEPRGVLPPSAICRWAAEILTALESLHNCGVICGDLSPSDVVIGVRGQALLTYMCRPAAWLGRVRPSAGRGCAAHVAPEARASAALSAALSAAADVWSFGALLYALLADKPLCHYHRSGFTSHTILHIPDQLTVEQESILTQLLSYEPSSRPSIPEIKQHPYFKSIDWSAVYEAWTPPD